MSLIKNEGARGNEHPLTSERYDSYDDLPSGDDVIRTHDQGLMSPLLYH